jgi:hypothetical protein
MTTSRNRVQPALRIVSQVGVVTAALTLVAGCGASGYKEGSYRACGQNLADPAGLPVVRFSPGGSVSPNSIVQFVANCDSIGVQVAVSPPGSVTVERIHTDDGGNFAVEFTFQGPARTLIVSEHGRKLGQMALLTT